MRSIFTSALCLSVLIASGLAGQTPNPVASSLEELACGPRPNELRRVRSSDGWSLVEWKPRAEAAPHFAKAEELFGQRRLSEAAVEYRRGLDLDPDYGPGWLYSGDVPFHNGDYAAALTAYRKALKLDPTLAQAHRFAADALLKLGRLDDAETEYVRALVYEPSYDGAWAGLEYLGQLAGFKVKRPEPTPPDGAPAEVEEAGLREGFLIVADLGPRCPLAVPLLPESELDQAEEYIRRFAIVRPGR